ncbi:bifunctional oligoribonuclease/PAP phosphatase NrnA [soil metagenome]
MADTILQSNARKRESVSLSQTAEILRSSDNILIVSHMRPDGDCLGSTIGLFLGLRTLGKRVAAYNSSEITGKWDFLQGSDNVKNTYPEWPVELTVFVDCGAVYRVSDTFKPFGATLNIDHHLTNDCFADNNYIDIDSCAVGEQIVNLLGELGVPLTPTIASALYLSVLTDTGGFRYPNTTDRAFRIASQLVAAGADPGSIAQEIFESRSKEEFALTARVLTSLRYEFNDTLVWGELRLADYAANGGTENEPEGLASEIRGVRGVEVSVLFHETPDGATRAGFRGKGRIDCSAIAKACGGGGHFNASGASIEGMPYEAARDKVLAIVRKAVAAYRPDGA